MLKFLKIALGVTYAAVALVTLQSPFLLLWHLTLDSPTAQTMHGYVADGRELLRSALDLLGRGDNQMHVPPARAPSDQMTFHGSGHGRGEHPHDKHPAIARRVRHAFRQRFDSWRYHDVRLLTLLSLSPEIVSRRLWQSSIPYCHVTERCTTGSAA